MLWGLDVSSVADFAVRNLPLGLIPNPQRQGGKSMTPLLTLRIVINAVVLLGGQLRLTHNGNIAIIRGIQTAGRVPTERRSR